METIRPKSNIAELDREEIFKAFDNLVNHHYKSLSSFLGENNSLLLVVNDNNRPTPTDEFLSILDTYLSNKNTDLFDREIGVIVATGSHSPPTDEGLEQILGSHHDELIDKTMIHRAKQSSHRFIGETKNNTPVLVDERIFGYDKILNINSVEPHYFAGYTGGRKSLLPGVSAWKTIEQNHEFALENEARALSLENNPVHQDMLDAVDLILGELNSEVCSINTVCTSSKILEVCCGDFYESFNQLTDTADMVFTAEVPEKKDIVIAEVGCPLNRSLYQSLKGFENGKLVTKEDGVLVLVTECREGVGPSKFYEAISSGEHPKEIIDDIEANYTLGEHKSSNLLKFLEKHDLFVVSEGIEDQKIRECFCEPFEDVDTALKAAREKVGEDPSVLKIEKAGNVVPRTN